MLVFCKLHAVLGLPKSIVSSPGCDWLDGLLLLLLLLLRLLLVVVVASLELACRSTGGLFGCCTEVEEAFLAWKRSTD
jgi:hypothetical protein